MEGYEAYKVNDIETASGLKLVVMLYGGAIRFCGIASEAIKEKKLDLAHNNIIKAQNIISELLVSLNYDAGDLAQTLSELYLYMHRRLVEANLQKNTEIIAEVIEILENLKAGWDELLKNETPTGRAASQNLNISG